MVLLLTVAFSCTSCIFSLKKSLFTVAGPGWKVQQGQAIWRPGSKYPELAGEIVMARHEDGRCAVQFAKTSLPVVLGQTTGSHWLIQFPPQHLTFNGGGTPPRRFTLLYLSAALAGRELPDNLKFQSKPDNGWRLENTSTGESLEGFLSP